MRRLGRAGEIRKTIKLFFKKPLTNRGFYGIIVVEVKGGRAVSTSRIVVEGFVNKQIFPRTKVKSGDFAIFTFSPESVIGEIDNRTKNPKYKTDDITLTPLLNSTQRQMLESSSVMFLRKIKLTHYTKHIRTQLRFWSAETSRRYVKLKELKRQRQQSY